MSLSMCTPIVRLYYAFRVSQYEDHFAIVNASAARSSHTVILRSTSRLKWVRVNSNVDVFR